MNIYPFGIFSKSNFFIIWENAVMNHLQDELLRKMCTCNEQQWCKEINHDRNMWILRRTLSLLLFWMWFFPSERGELGQILRVHLLPESPPVVSYCWTYCWKQPPMEPSECCYLKVCADIISLPNKSNSQFL